MTEPYLHYKLNVHADILQSAHSPMKHIIKLIYASVINEVLTAKANFFNTDEHTLQKWNAQGDPA
jgi:hypothetical protein